MFPMGSFPDGPYSMSRCSLLAAPENSKTSAAASVLSAHAGLFPTVGRAASGQINKQHYEAQINGSYPVVFKNHTSSNSPVCRGELGTLAQFHQLEPETNATTCC